MTGAAAIAALALVACDYGEWSPMPDFRVIGHRGAPHDEAENTLPSLRAAVASGANAVEIDLCVTEDDRVVLWHDEDPDSGIALARQSGAEGLPWRPMVPSLGASHRRPVPRLTAAELFDHYGYGDGASRDSGARIPELAEVLQWARTEPELRWIYLDVKTTSETRARRIVQEVARARDAGDLDQLQLVAISPDRSVVRALEDERAELGLATMVVAPDFEGRGELAATRELGLADVSTGLTPARTWSMFLEDVEGLVRARDDGELDSVTVWTLDREMQIDELLFARVDGVMTNHPDLLADHWRETLD